MRHRFLLILLLVAAGCAEWEDEPTVRIEASPLAPELARAESGAALETGQDAIRVRRMIAVPDPCHSLEANLTRIEGDLRLWITTRPAEEACAPEEAYLSYTAEIEGLRPGRYNLRVIHGQHGVWRGTETVLKHPIVVLERSVRVSERS